MNIHEWVFVDIYVFKNIFLLIIERKGEGKR